MKPQAKTKKTSSTAKGKAETHDNNEELDAIFGKLKDSKKVAVKEATQQMSSNSAKKSSTEQPKKRDGLYRKKEVTVELSDQEFFNGKGVSSSAGTSAANAALRAREGVDKIVSMRELQKMLSHNSRAGSTPNCPFDCDCCF